MKTGARLAAFGLAALGALAAGGAIGALVGPIDPAPAPNHEEDTMTATETDTRHESTESAEGYRIDADTSSLRPGTAMPLTFRVLDPSGRAVTRFRDRHEPSMHLVVVSADGIRYAHLHPTLAADGTWTASLPALDPGAHRLFADTAPVGAPDLVLVHDLLVPGVAPSRSVPEPATAVTVDGLTVDLLLTRRADGLTASFTVRRNGADLRPDPYLGARGHLLALALDDLEYLHVHPDDTATIANTVTFAIAEPARGRSRLFFDFSLDGTVRTAAFTVDVTEDGPASSHTHTAEDDHR